MEYSMRIYKVEKEDSNLRGFVTLSFDNCFCAKSIALKEAASGRLYLEMPKYKDYETGEYMSYFDFKDGEFRKTVTEQVKEAYEQITDKMIDVNHEWGDEELYYDLSVTPIRGNNTFKAEAAMKLQDVFVIQQMKVIQGWNSKTFVGMPQRENSTKKEKEDIAHPINGEFKKELEGAIMEEYYRKVELQKTQQQQRKGR